MKVTVKECLQMELFEKAKVVAAERDLSNIVKDVVVLEGVTSAEAAKVSSYKSKMIMTGFFHVRNNVKEQIEIVKALAGVGCSALVIFHVGVVVREIARTVKDAAELYRLPIIIFEGDEPTAGETANKMLKDFFFGESFNNSLINNTIFHLLNFERYSSFQAAAKAAAVNNDFQMVIVSPDFNPIFSVETRHRVEIEEAVTAHRETGGEQREVQDRVGDTFMDVNGVITYWGPVTIKDDKYYLMLVDNGDRYSSSEITKLAEIIELAMGMWKYTPERDAKAEFIKALRRGNKSLAYTLKSEVGVKGNEIINVFYARIPQDNEFFNDLEREEGLKVFKGVDGDETYGVIIYDSPDSTNSADQLSAARMRCNEIFNSLKGANSEGHIFHVTGLDGIEGAADAFRLIIETWMFAQNLFPLKHVFSKFEMVLTSNCINIQLQGNYVKRNYIELLEPFKELGENKGRQLLETLEIFVLDARMNSMRTSEIMGIHTNTVQYRLKKINDVLGVEVTGNRIVPGLTISLALKRLEKIVR